MQVQDFHRFIRRQVATTEQDDLRWCSAKAGETFEVFVLGDDDEPFSGGVTPNIPIRVATEAGPDGMDAAGVKSLQPGEGAKAQILIE